MFNNDSMNYIGLIWLIGLYGPYLMLVKPFNIMKDAAKHHNDYSNCNFKILRYF